MRDVQKPRPLVRAYRAMRSRSRAVLTRKKRDQPKDKPLGGTLTLDDSDDMNDSLGGEERVPEQSEEATEQSSDDCTPYLAATEDDAQGFVERIKASLEKCVLHTVHKPKASAAACVGGAGAQARDAAAASDSPDADSPDAASYAIAAAMGLGTMGWVAVQALLFV